MPAATANSMQRYLKSIKLTVGERLPSVSSIASGMGTTVPEAKELLAQLVSKDAVTEIDGIHFLGSFALLKSPEFDRSLELQRALGEYFSIKQEYGESVDFHLSTVKAPKHQVPLHSHDHFELVYVNSGTATHRYGNKRYPVVAGDCFFILPGQRHCFIDVSNFTVSNAGFYESVLDPFWKSLRELPGFTWFISVEPVFREETSFQHKLHLDIHGQKLMASLFGTMAEELAKGTADGYLLAQLKLCECLVYLVRCFDESVGASDSREEFSNKERLVENAVAYLENNYSTRVRPADVGKYVCTSVSHLQHLFKEVTGSSLTDYTTNLRIEEACHLLESTDLPNLNIAARVGFHDPYYFSRAFKKKIGMAPSAYRKKQRRS